LIRHSAAAVVRDLEALSSASDPCESVGGSFEPPLRPPSIEEEQMLVESQHPSPERRKAALIVRWLKNRRPDPGYLRWPLRSARRRP
jgi:hypothetical protein